MLDMLFFVLKGCGFVLIVRKTFTTSMVFLACATMLTSMVSANANPTLTPAPAGTIIAPSGEATPSDASTPIETVSPTAVPTSTPTVEATENVAPDNAIASTLVPTSGAIGERFAKDGGYNKASYGNPIAPISTVDDIDFQRFERGTLVYSPSTGVHLMHGAIHGKWLDAGGVTSKYGIPTSDEKARDNGRGVTQDMIVPKTGARGVMTWNDWGSGAQYVYLDGGIGGHWKNLGAFNNLGYPTSEEQCGFLHGSCYQSFERGTIVWTPTYGSVVIRGDIRRVWNEAGGIKSGYGIPISNEIVIGTNRVEQKFLNSYGRTTAFYWSPSTGSQYINLGGAIGGLWAREGGANSKLGLPIAPEQCGFIHGSCYQDYQNGTIVWSPKWGTHILFGAIRGKWKESGGMKSPYGIPASGERLVGNEQVEQLFVDPNGKDGAIYWTNQGTGTNHVYFGGAIGSFWANNGNFRQNGVGTPKRFGFPTGAETCSNGRCHQKFQYGVITWDNFGGGTRGYEAQKCHALNDGRSKYSPQGANRVALALAPRYANYRFDWGAIRGNLYSCLKVHNMYVLDWKTQASFGENGFLAPNRQIRDYETGVLLPPGVTGSTSGAYSPTGSFKLSQPFGVQNPGSGFSGYRTLNPNSRWGGDRNTWYYNKYIENPSLGYPNENMWNFAVRGDYRQGILANYNVNDDGSVPSGTAGFAIFLHTIPTGSAVYDYPTWGCVAIDHERMKQFLREGRDGDRIIMGVESEVIR